MEILFQLEVVNKITSPFYNMDLYSDKHPETTMKGTGFKNIQRAKKTIELIKYRSPKYQYDVINTMYNRAKYHPHQTEEMREAMEIFHKWLKNYKKEKIKYPYLQIEKIKKYNGNGRFVEELEKVNGRYHKLKYVPIGKYDYLSLRNKVIDKIMEKKPVLFKKNGYPTREHIKLISYGYSPYSINL